MKWLDPVEDVWIGLPAWGRWVIVIAVLAVIGVVIKAL